MVRKTFHVVGSGVKEGELHVERMRAAGFVDLYDKVYKWPLTPWLNDT